MSEAQDLLRELGERGLSQSNVAEALGRSRSMVSKVAVGKSSGDKYVPALRGLLSGRAVSPPAHAQGRQVPDRIALIRGGRVLTRQSAGRDIRPAIAAAARRTADTGHRDQRGRVAIRIEGLDADGRHIGGTIFDRGGITGEQMQAAINKRLEQNGIDPARAKPEDIADALVGVVEDLAGDAQAGYLDGLASVLSISVEAR